MIAVLIGTVVAAAIMGLELVALVAAFVAWGCTQARKPLSIPMVLIGGANMILWATLTPGFSALSLVVSAWLFVDTCRALRRWEAFEALGCRVDRE